MRRTVAIPLLIVAVCLGAHRAYAVDVISWGTAQNITAATDVSNVGTLLDAGAVGAAVGPGTGTVVNGVKFYGLSTGGSPSTDAYGYISATYLGVTNVSTGALTNTTYGDILKYALYGFVNGSATQTVTLGNATHPLTVGHVYQVQYWVNQPAPGANNGSGAVLSGAPSVTLYGDASATHQSGSLGQYAIGTFTATAITNSFTYSANGPAGINYELLNAIQLRDLGPVPEPSTWIGGAMAAAVLGWSQRRRLRRAARFKVGQRLTAGLHKCSIAGQGGPPTSLSEFMLQKIPTNHSDNRK